MKQDRVLALICALRCLARLLLSASLSSTGYHVGLTVSVSGLDLLRDPRHMPTILMLVDDY